MNFFHFRTVTYLHWRSVLKNLNPHLLLTILISPFDTASFRIPSLPRRKKNEIESYFYDCFNWDTSWSKKRNYLGRVKRIWYLSPMRAATVQASLRIRAVSPEPPLLAQTSSESRGTFRQKARSIALWMAGHAQLKFVITECSKTQICLTGLIYSSEY